MKAKASQAASRLKTTSKSTNNKTRSQQSHCLQDEGYINQEFKLADSNLCQIANDLLKQAKKLGADAAELDLAIGNGFSLNVRKGQLETIEHSSGKDLGLTVYFGKRTGTAVTSDFSPEAIQLMLEKACHIAKYTNEDPCVGLADAELLAKNYPDLDLYHPWHLQTDAAIEIAKNCEEQGFAEDKRIINSEGCRLSSTQNFYIYANTNDFLGKTYTTRHSYGCSLIAKENGKMQSDTYYTIARDPHELESITAVANKAASRTVQRLNARHISTRQCPVIFSAEIASSLLADFISAISGGNLYRKATFLLDHLGKQVFPTHVHIDERPLIPKALGSAAYDAEGVALKQSDIVTAGILDRYVLDSYTARKLNMQTTGNSGGIFNLFINTESYGLTELLQKMGSGFLVTDLLGDGVNIITGDYSRGIFGYWVENGVIQYPVESATIAGNLKEMFLNLIAVANDIDWRSGILTGSILLEKMTLAGN